MRKLILILLAVLALSACGSRVGYERHHTPDGRDVECFVYHVGFKGGISCNWPGTKP
jgi:hypothetical protein